MPDKAVSGEHQQVDAPEASAAATAALSCICVLVALHLITGWQPFGWATSANLVILICFGHGLMKAREFFLLAFAGATAVLVLLMSDAPMPVLLGALERGAFLGAFMLFLSLLRDAAATSESVLAVGRMLTLQPPGRRYWAIAGGGHLMGVIMNFGALSLLAPLIQRGTRTASANLDPRIGTIREQRQLSALARGFSWFIAWSPTAIAQLVAITVVPGVSAIRMASAGAAIAMLVVMAGWIIDRLTGVRARKMLGEAAPAKVPHEPFPIAECVRLAAIYAVLILLSLLCARAIGEPLVIGIMLASAPMTLIWIAAQIAAGCGGGRSLARRAADLVTSTIPGGSPEAITLALAGFIGTALAAIIPAGGNGTAALLAGIEPIVIYMAAATLIPLASMAALPPMLTVTFLGTFLTASSAGLDPSLLALSLVLGWAINLTASPFGATNLVLSRMTGIATPVLAFRWNGSFSLAAWAISVIALAVLAA